MTVFLFVLPALVAAVLSSSLTPAARRLALRVGAIDEPGPRKVHKTPLPREKLGDALAAGDVHLVTLRPRIPGLLVPSKIYGILAAGRPTGRNGRAAICPGARHFRGASPIPDLRQGSFKFCRIRQRSLNG